MEVYFHVPAQDCQCQDGFVQVSRPEDDSGMLRAQTACGPHKQVNVDVGSRQQSLGVANKLCRVLRGLASRVICLSDCLFVGFVGFVGLSVCLSVCPFVCLPVLSVCLFIWLVC